MIEDEGCRVIVGSWKQDNPSALQPGFAGDPGPTGMLAHSTPAANASLQTASLAQGDAQPQQQLQQAQPTQQPQQHASPPLRRDPRQQQQQQQPQQLPQQPQQHSAMQHQPLQASGHGLQLSFEPHQQQMAAAVGQYPGLPFGPMGPLIGHLPGYPPPLQPLQPHMQPQSQPMAVGRVPDGTSGSGVSVPGEDPSSMDDILNYFLKDAAAAE